ncbi:MAG: Lsm family RNA-binding protein [Promethearchaeota archaeon]
MESRQFIGFNKEMSLIIGSKVKVQLKTKDNYYITGAFKGFSKTAESIFLTDAKDTLGNLYSKIIIHGNEWITITLEKTPFPMEGLYQRLKNMFPPGQVQYDADVGALTVMRKIHVTEKGVTGEGPLVEKVKNIFRTYVDEVKKQNNQ